MKRSLILMAVTCAALIEAPGSYGQDSSNAVPITQSDAKKIKYLAQEALEQFQEALNFIVTSEIPAPDFNNLIQTSYSQGARRTFYDSSSILVQDLEDVSVKGAPSADMVKDYLTDFNIFTVKDQSASVQFSNYQVSDIKRGSYLYLQIAYDCQYNCKSLRMDKVPLEHKVAEFRVYKEGNTWKAYIATVSFFNPADSDKLRSGGIALAPDPGNTADTALVVARDTAQLMLKPVLTEEQKEQIRKDNEALAARRLTDEGDSALSHRDLFKALKCFTYAQKIDAANPYLKARIEDVNRSIAQQNITPDQQYDTYIQQATLAKGQHRYDAARVAYDKALSLKPAQSDQLRPVINELTAKALLLNRIGLKMGDKDIKGALEVCKTAVTQYPADPVFLLRRAVAYELQGDAKQARKDYAKAVDMEPGYLDAYLLRGAYYDRLKDFNGALSDYTLVAQTDKANDSVYLLTASVNVEKSDVVKAVAELDKGIALNPGRVAFYQQKGELQYDLQHQPAQALPTFGTAVEKDASVARAWYYRGLCEVDLNKVEDAAKDFAQARLLHLEDKLASHVAGLAVDFYIKGQDAFLNRKGEDALTLYSDAIEIDPSRDFFRLARGDAYFYLEQRYADGADNYTQAISLRAANDTAYQQRGRARYNLGIYDQSAADLDSAILLNPQVPERYLYRGEAHFQLKAYDPAIKDFDEVQVRAKALKRELPDSIQVTVFDTRGECYYQQGNYAVALENFKNAVKFNKAGNPSILFDRGKTYFKLNQLKDAQADVGGAVAQRSGNATWDLTLGDIDRQMGNFADAVTQYSAALTADPSSAEALHDRALCQLKLANFQGALSDLGLLRTQGMDGKYPGFNDEVGTAYIKLNKPDSAIASFGAALARDSSDADALYGMGEAALAQNQKDAALGWLARALSTGKIHKSTIKEDKSLDAIREDKAFRALLKKYSDQMPK